MSDRSLKIFFMLLFGASGIAVTLLSWLIPSLAPVRIMATIIGAVGFFMALIHALMIRWPSERGDEQVLVEVESKKEP